MSASRTVLVVGGSPAARSRRVGDLIDGCGGTALVLTADPVGLDPRLDAGDDGPVEVRYDDPAARVASFLSGAVAPEDPVLGALAVGTDAPLAATLGFEYARRACEAAAWDLVVLEIDGDLSALRRFAAPGALAAFVEEHWPANVRFASIAAGERAEPLLRDAQRIAETATAVGAWLATGPDVVAAEPEEAAGLCELIDLARGALVPALEGDPATGYRLRIPLATEPGGPVRVEGGRALVPLAGVDVSLALPAVLRRCVLSGSRHEAGSGVLVAEFRADENLWPPDLVRPVDASTAG